MLLKHCLSLEFNLTGFAFGVFPNSIGLLLDSGEMLSLTQLPFHLIGSLPKVLTSPKYSCVMFKPFLECSSRNILSTELLSNNYIEVISTWPRDAKCTFRLRFQPT